MEELVNIGNEYKDRIKRRFELENEPLSKSIYVKSYCKFSEDECKCREQEVSFIIGKTMFFSS